MSIQKNNQLHYSGVDADDMTHESKVQDVESQDELVYPAPWQRQKAEWMRQLSETPLANIPHTICSTIQQLPLAAKIAPCFLIIMSAVFLLLLHSTSSAQSWHGRSMPQILADLPWNSSVTGLSSDVDLSLGSYRKSLGKDLVVLDVDTRPWKIENPANLSQLTWGRLNHYLYAHMHGYDYKFIQAPEPAADLHATWVKVQAIRDVFQQGYKFVVFTDSDVMFPHLQIPMEYLLDRWNVTSDIALTLGYAPNLPSRVDQTHHKQIVNTGFMVVQNTPETDQMLKDWIECPSDTKYPGCSRWKDILWHEQSAYSDYIRYDYANITREIPCNEVNGAPEHNETGDRHCDGLVVRHYWVAKNKVKEAVQASIAELVLPTLVEDLVRESIWAT